MFYNDSTMKNRFHYAFADHPVLLNMGLGADRIWFTKDAAIAVPSNYTLPGSCEPKRAIGSAGNHRASSGRNGKSQSR